MENYKSKSNKTKEERKPQEKVVNGTVTVKKKSPARKFTDVFISEDVSNVKSYIFTDVLVPALKKLVSDIVKDGIDMFMYGGTRRGDTRPSGYRADTVSYNRYSDKNYGRRVDGDIRARSTYSYDEIIFPSRGDAEIVLDRMLEILEQYDMVSIADFYEMAGLTGEYTDLKYGWTSLRGVEAVRHKDGFVLDLPRAIPLK